VRDRIVEGFTQNNKWYVANDLKKAGKIYEKEHQTPFHTNVTT
jgi:hypothetical protein